MKRVQQGVQLPCAVQTSHVLPGSLYLGGRDHTLFLIFYAISSLVEWRFRKQLNAWLFGQRGPRAFFRPEHAALQFHGTYFLLLLFSLKMYSLIWSRGAMNNIAGPVVEVGTSASADLSLPHPSPCPPSPSNSPAGPNSLPLPLFDAPAAAMNPIAQYTIMALFGFGWICIPLLWLHAFFSNRVVCGQYVPALVMRTMNWFDCDRERTAGPGIQGDGTPGEVVPAAEQVPVRDRHAFMRIVYRGLFMCTFTVHGTALQRTILGVAWGVKSGSQSTVLHWLEASLAMPFIAYAALYFAGFSTTENLLNGSHRSILHMVQVNSHIGELWTILVPVWLTRALLYATVVIVQRQDFPQLMANFRQRLRSNDASAAERVRAGGTSSTPRPSEQAGDTAVWWLCGIAVCTSAFLPQIANLVRFAGTRMAPSGPFRTHLNAEFAFYLMGAAGLAGSTVNLLIDICQYRSRQLPELSVPAQQEGNKNVLAMHARPHRRFNRRRGVAAGALLALCGISTSYSIMYAGAQQHYAPSSSFTSFVSPPPPSTSSLPPPHFSHCWGQKGLLAISLLPSMCGSVMGCVIVLLSFQRAPRTFSADKPALFRLPSIAVSVYPAVCTIKVIVEQAMDCFLATDRTKLASDELGYFATTHSMVAAHVLAIMLLDGNFTHLVTILGYSFIHFAVVSDDHSDIADETVILNTVIHVLLLVAFLLRKLNEKYLAWRRPHGARCAHDVLTHAAKSS